MMTELRPRPNLEQLLERSCSAGKRKESVGAVGHHGFPLVHRADLTQFGETRMRQFALDQGARDNADDTPASLHGGIGDRSHQADSRPAVDERQASAGNRAPDQSRRLGIAFARAGIGAAENADGMHRVVLSRRGAAYAASAPITRAHDRVPRWKQVRLYFSLGE